MRARTKWLAEVTAMIALGLALAGPSLAQTTATVDVRKFEVIAVDGSKLVVRDQNGTQELTVPADFRFTVDGKKLAVSDLKPGMKGTATVTTKTTITPVVVTDVREAVVLRASDVSMTVRVPDGTTRRFTRGDLSTRGIQIFMEGKPVQMGDLNKGDKLPATIVTSAPPTILTQKEVQATLDEANAPQPTPSAAAPAQPASPAAAAQAPQPTSPTIITASSSRTESAGPGMAWYLLIGAIVAGALFFFVSHRGKPA
jgi:hypothetical protein